MKTTLFITCEHDRHTDDKYLIFATEKLAKSYLEKRQHELSDERYRWDDADITTDYGDYCIYLSEDYYLMYKEVEFVDSESK